jgi:sugar-specific transcriptional regulator TrmB
MPIWKVEEIEEKTSAMLKKLISTAKQDDVVTEDEKNIINHIEKMLWDVESEIELVIDESPEKFQDALAEMLKEILDKAKEIAGEDGHISDDERELIDKIKEYINKQGLNDFI